MTTTNPTPSTEYLPLVDPSTGETFDQLPMTTPTEFDVIVGRAATAQRHWASLDPSDRTAALRRFADTIDRHAEELNRLESRDVGKPLAQSSWEAPAVADVIRYYAATVELPSGQAIPVDGGQAVAIREPIGVVGCVTPWNYPMLIASWKFAPALACGNAAVLKPSELAPSTARRIAELADEAELPNGLLSAVVGDGRLGEAVVRHSGVRAVSFTGSTAVGRKVMEAATEGITRTVLELGGKNVAVVFEDADLDEAAGAAAAAAFENTGQDCCARTRLLVARSVFDDAVERAVAGADSLHCGLPDDPNAYCGPVISHPHRDRIEAMLADVDASKHRLDVPDTPGSWVPPTVVIDPDPQSRLVQHEIFGPVLLLEPFDNERELIERLNATEHGLAGSVWTQDIDRANRVARDLEVGTVSVNSNRVVRTNTPFGGVKHSGVGRELGLAALDSYSNLKTIFTAVRPRREAG